MSPKLYQTRVALAALTTPVAEVAAHYDLPPALVDDWRRWLAAATARFGRKSDLGVGL